jgi:hypothetical protein
MGSWLLRALSENSQFLKKQRKAKVVLNVELGVR